MSESLENTTEMEYITIQYYHQRCRCKEVTLNNKKRNRELGFKPKPLEYPIHEKDQDPPQTKTFQIKYKKKLSTLEKNILNTFESKYIYYAMDDILELLRTNAMESEDLLVVIYSAMISLQNNFFVNFFDIWIQEIYLEEISKKNKFLKENSTILEPISYITLKLLYKSPAPPKETKPLW